MTGYVALVVGPRIFDIVALVLRVVELVLRQFKTLFILHSRCEQFEQTMMGQPR
jgi:hypothetical protein